MGGEGSMMLARTLLKLNERKHNNLFKQPINITAYPDRFEAQKATLKEQARLKQIVQSYQRYEQARKSILLIVLFLLFIGIMLFLL